MSYNMYNGLNITSDIPYPNINNLKPNIPLAYKIKKAYCGQISELSCITKYIYQQISLNDDFKEIKYLLKSIAIVEMKHLEILGNILKKLGISPIYTYLNKVENENYWNSSFISYEMNIISFIKENIKDENKTIKLYEEIIKETNDEERNLSFFNHLYFGGINL